MTIEALELLELGFGQPEVDGADDRIDLLGPPAADDRADDRAVPQSPGYGDLRAAATPAVRDGAQRRHERSVRAQPRLGEVPVRSPKVRGWELGDALSRHRARE